MLRIKEPSSFEAHLGGATIGGAPKEVGVTDVTCPETIFGSCAPETAETYLEPAPELLAASSE
jgi:hypothetical protein